MYSVLKFISVSWSIHLLTWFSVLF